MQDVLQVSGVLTASDTGTILPSGGPSVGGVAAAFLGWKYYQSRSAAAYDPEAAPVEPGMEDAGVHPDSPEKRDQALKMGMNIALYAMRGGMTP